MIKRTIPAAMQAKLDAGAAVLANLYKFTAADGAVRCFTDTNVDVVYDDGAGGQTYAASGGVTRSALDSRTDMAADSSDLTGFLEAAFPASELLAGKWNYARVDQYLVDVATLPPTGHVILDRFHLGEVQLRGASFTAELRGLHDKMNHPVGRVCTANCPYDWGDARCGKDKSEYRQTGSVATSTDDTVLTFTGLDDSTATAPALGFSLPVTNADFSQGLTGWTELLGTWQAGESGDPKALGSDPYARARPDDKANDPEATLGQIIDLVASGISAALIDGGTMVLALSADINSDKDNDKGEVVLRFLDGLEAEISNHPSGLIYPHDKWQQARISAAVPATARYAQIEMHAVSSSSKDADVGFTNVGVTVSGTGIVAGDGWFTGGVIRFTSGQNAGVGMEITDWQADTLTATLFNPMPYSVAPGDTFDIWPGCTKDAAGCILFDNIARFGGYPFVPGSDRMGLVPGLKD